MKTTRNLHFAGYDFSASNNGTVIHRPTPVGSKPCPFKPDDKVGYREISLFNHRGTVTKTDEQWVWVRWETPSYLDNVEAREWARNLKMVPCWFCGKAASESSVCARCRN